MAGTAAVVLIVSPEGIPLVRDPSKPSPLFWKLPGGHGEIGEDAHMCAVREIKEETGICLDIAQLEELRTIDRGNHTLVVFKAVLMTLDNVKQQGNEGEEVRIFTPLEILRMRDFMPNHLVVVAKILTELAAAQH